MDGEDDLVQGQIRNFPMGSGAEHRSGNCRLRKMPWDNFLLFAHLKTSGKSQVQVCSWTRGTLVQLGRGSTA